LFSKYRELGLALIPLKPESKAPLLDAWTQFCDRLPTEEECEKWEKYYPDRYGQVCGPASGVMWVDIDSDDPAILNAVKPSPVRKRGRKGESRAFKFDPDVLSCKVAGIIDILAYGHQTVLPPTLHPETEKPYVWITPDTLENFSITDLPTFTQDDLNDIRRILEPAKFESGETSGVSLQGPFFNDDTKRLSPHGSHDRLKRIVSAIIARGASPDEAVRELLRYDEENHKPTGYFADGTRSDCFADPVSNALFFYASNVRTFNRRQVKTGQIPAIPLVSGSELIDVSQLMPQTGKAFESKKWPEPTGTLKDLRDLILQSSKRHQPGLALGGAIAIGSVVIANRFKFGNTWPNLFIINVANTGAGKSFPYTAAKKLLNAENELDLLGAGGYRSSTAILKDLVGRRERLDLIDECSSLFKTMRDGGIFQSDMMDILNQLWSDSSSLFIGPEAAGREKIQVWHPCITALLSTTPDGLKNSISREFVTQGFLPRCLIFNDVGYGEITKDTWDDALAQKIVRKFQEMQAYGAVDKRNLAGPRPGPEEIESTLEARTRLDSYALECAEKLAEPSRDEVERHFFSRAAQQAAKLALIHGALSQLRIGLSDVEWAIDVLEALSYNASALLPQMGAENNQESNVMRILQIIQVAGKIAHGALVAKTRFLKTPERTEMLTSLEVEGRIQSSVEITVTRPAKIYSYLR
jgi:hypothetical protein